MLEWESNIGRENNLVEDVDGAVRVMGKTEERANGRSRGKKE